MPDKKINMIYDINEKPPLKRLIITAIQQVTACFVATVLIPQICGVPIAPALVGAGVGTLVYQLFTKFKSPMFISSSGAFVAAVIGALAIGGYSAAFVGGIIIAIVYSLIALMVYKSGTAWIDKFLPPVVIGPVVAVIGLNLATFLPTYFQIDGQYNLIGIMFGLITLVLAAAISHYGKGFIKSLPFLLSMAIMYIVACVLTLTGIVNLVDFTSFKNLHGLFEIPDFSFFKLSGDVLPILPQLLLLYVPISLVGFSEHLSDHKALSGIIDHDLTKEPGLHRTLVGDGVASCIGALICGLPNTSYGESVGTTGFSRVAYTGVITLASIIMIIAGFFAPLQALLVSIPSYIFGGCAAILYGFIALSGIKMIINSNINLDDNKNITILSAVLTIGVGGVVLNFGWISFGTTALAMIVGIVLNLVLKNKKGEK